MLRHFDDADALARLDAGIRVVNLRFGVILSPKDGALAKMLTPFKLGGGGIVGNGKPDTPHEIDIEFTGAWGDANHFFTTHDPDIKSPGQGFFHSLDQDLR